MRINLQTLSHKPLVWKNALPAQFKGVLLPGGTLATAQGEYGSVCIQEYREKHFCIQYKVFDILQHFVTTEKYSNEGLCSRLILKGDMQQVVGSFDNKHVYTNNLVYVISPSSLTTVFENKQCATLDAFFNTKLINETLTEYPDLKRLFETSSKAKPPVTFGDLETFDLVYSILHSKYKKSFRRLFYETRIRDLLFKYLVLIADHKPNIRKPNDEEIIAIHRAADIIREDITKHHPIHQLAAIVRISVPRFKDFFKQVFGIGPYEYLLKQRMRKAKEMLEEGYSIKEISTKMNYRPSDFTVLFRQQMGFYPSDIKKRGK